MGRSQQASGRIISECKVLNPEREFIFLKNDVGLIRNVDELWEEIKTKEKNVNILFLSAGQISIEGKNQDVASRIIGTGDNRNA
jgi:hypothetical protein